MPKARILIVEDEAVVAGEIQGVLTHLGYPVTGQVVSGEEALASVEANLPDLVLMDIMLGGDMDGIEAAELIHERFDIPVVYLTAHDDEGTLQHAKVSDPFGYILKPFKSRELHIAIEMALYRHRTEQRLRELNLQLQEASRHKSDFLANMSHELRTPLNAMIGYTSLTLNALKGNLPPEHLQNLTRAEQSARVLLQLINDVLDFSKIEAGRLETFIEEIDPDELLEEVVMTAEGLLSGKTVELREDFSSNLPMIESDYTRLKQILDNLVGNAIKFTEHGHVAIRAHLLKNASTIGNGDTIGIDVEDTGCGIPNEVLEHIFELFRQADGSTKKKFAGTGLGLAISKRLSDMLGISIDVESRLEQGTRFRLQVPVKFDQERIVSSALMNSLSEETLSFDAPGRSQENFRHFDAPGTISSRVPKTQETEPELKALVLCFGQPQIEALLGRYLANLPLEIVHVATVKECQRYLSKQPIWSIVLEAGEQGFAILAQLKADQSLRDIPIIMASPQVAQHGHYVGSVEYLEKPIEHHTLLDTLLRITRVPQGHILVVDDDKNVQEIFTQILTNAGYTVTTASNSKEALAILEEHENFQAILLDLMMPQMNGFQVLERVQRHAIWQRIPIVVVTAKTLTDEERHALHQGLAVLEQKGAFSVQGISKPITSITQAVALAGTRSILVIDDNEMNLNLMSGVFETSGYTVYKAPAAHKGIELAKQVLPDTIVMDLAMPDMDGFEATQILKRDPVTADITVIACSAFATREYKEHALQVGCEGYITKPIEPNRLVEQVTKLVLHSKIRKKKKRISK